MTRASLSHTSRPPCRHARDATNRMARDRMLVGPCRPCGRVRTRACGTPHGDTESADLAAEYGAVRPIRRRKSLIHVNSAPLCSAIIAASQGERHDRFLLQPADVEAGSAAGRADGPHDGGGWREPGTGRAYRPGHGVVRSALALHCVYQRAELPQLAPTTRTRKTLGTASILR